MFSFQKFILNQSKCQPWRETCMQIQAKIVFDNEKHNNSNARFHLLYLRNPLILHINSSSRSVNHLCDALSQCINSNNLCVRGKMDFILTFFLSLWVGFLVSQFSELFETFSQMFVEIELTECNFLIRGVMVYWMISIWEVHLQL